MLYYFAEQDSSEPINWIQPDAETKLTCDETDDNRFKLLTGDCNSFPSPLPFTAFPRCRVRGFLRLSFPDDSARCDRARLLRNEGWEGGLAGAFG